MPAPWKSDPKCGKCRRTSPNMQWGRWVAIEGVGYVRSTNPAHPELLLLTCVRCGYQWAMDLAPADVPLVPKSAEVPAA